MQYSFQTFYLALQSSIGTQTQIDLIKEELKATTIHAVHTHVAQYARHPRSAHKMRELRTPDAPGAMMSFEKSRRRGVCAACSAKWERRHN